MSRRKRAKHPALKPGLNTKGRLDYIEADYINGVRDENGVLVIRPLTEEEKDWLNQFYQETIITNFNKDGSDFYESVQERRALWRENNRRNKCVFTKAKKTNCLHSLEVLDLDAMLPDVGKLYDPENIFVQLERYGVDNYDDLVDLIEEF
jgi:hypothetical protein